MAYLTKADILKADDLPAEDVEVPEWGGVVRIRGFTATERDRFEFSMAAAKNNPADVEVRAAVVGRCLVDEEGQRLFTDKEIAKLGAKSGTALDRCFEVVRRLSGMDDSAATRAAEDFGNAPDAGSPTG